jgi:heptosyltransferase-3
LPPLDPEKIKRVLVYRCGTIGDTIVAVPAINLLRRHFNKALFLLMTANSGGGKVWADDVLKEFDWFEEFITYSSSDLRRPRNIFTLTKKIRASNPDIVVYMASDKNSALKIWRDSLFFRLAGVKTFIPYYSTKVTFWGLQKRADKVYAKEVIRLVEGLQRLGISSREISFNLPIKQGHVQKVSELIAEAGLDSQRPLIGMCPWSKQEAKRWPIERYAELGKQLIRELNVNIAIVGGQEEAVVGKDISRSWPEGRWAIFAGALGILETAELLRRCHFYVGNDTGSMHLAAAVDTPCVAIFSAREPVGSWYPYGDHHIVLRKKVPCRNCYLTECNKDKIYCLDEITLEEVWVACKQMFEESKKRGPFTIV